MKNLKIGKKLMISFGTVMVLFLICIVAAVVCINNVAKSLDTFFNQSHQVMVAQLDMQRGIQSSVKNILWSCTTEDLGEVTEYLNEAQKQLDSVESNLAIVKEKFLGDATLIADFEKTMYESVPYKDDIIELAKKNDMRCMEIYNTNYAPTLQKAQVYLEKIGADSAERASSLYKTGQTVKSLSIWILLGIALVSFGVIVCFCIYVTKSITRPVIEIEKAAKAISTGNLSTDVNYQSKDEMGSLALSIRNTASTLSSIINDINYLLGEMASGNFCIKTKVEESYVGDFKPILLSMRNINRSLSSTLSSIGQSAEQVAGGSDQVASGSQALSQGATEQASSIEELAATINEISEEVKRTAENAEDAKEMSTVAGEEVEKSNKQMQELMQAMKDISDSSSEIGKIIKTIEDIAFQTNILALNAAVEAARAGAAGKGFAVVADEVRNLASKSAEASKNTSSLIENSIKAVERGIRIANGTAESLGDVVIGARHVAETVEKISAATKIQASSVEQVTVGVDQISSVVQTNSATAEESAAASQELSGQAQMLKDLVSRFKLIENNYDMPVQSQADIATQSAYYSESNANNSFSASSKY